MQRKLPPKTAQKLREITQLRDCLSRSYAVARRRFVVNKEGRPSGILFRPVSISHFLNSVGFNASRLRSPTFVFLSSLPREFKGITEIRMDTLFALTAASEKGIDMVSKDYLLSTASHAVPVGRLPHETASRTNLKVKIDVPADPAALLRNGKKWDALIGQRMQSLKKHGSLFIKPAHMAGGAGVFRISLSNRQLEISSEEKTFLHGLLNRFPRARLNANTVQIRLSGNENELREIIGRITLLAYPQFMKKTYNEMKL